MRKELEKLTTKQLIKLVKTFEHYPAVTLKDGKDYILSYLEDEACSISEKEIAEYLLKNGVLITKENIHLFYQFMSDEQIKSLDSSDLRDIKTGTPLISTILSRRMIIIREILCLHPSVLDKYKNYTFGLNDSVLAQSIFGVKDILKPIDEYIAEIKDSEQYKIFTSECRCNNCMT